MPQFLRTLPISIYLTYLYATSSEEAWAVIPLHSLRFTQDRNSRRKQVHEVTCIAKNGAGTSPTLADYQLDIAFLDLIGIVARLHCGAATVLRGLSHCWTVRWRDLALRNSEAFS